MTDKLKDAGSSMFSSLSGAVGSVTGAVKDGASATWSVAEKVPGVKTIGNGVGAVADGVGSGVGAVAGGVKGGVGAVAGGVTSGVGAVAGGVTSSFTTLKVLNADTKLKVMGLSPWKLSKIGRIIENMQRSEFQFSDAEVDLVVKALYVSQDEGDFKAAFDMLDEKLNNGAQGGLRAEEFRKVLPLVGEDVPDDKIDEFFKEVDSDGSGVLEFGEFHELMLRMNPKDESGLSVNKVPGFGLVSGGFSLLGDNFTTMSVLRATTQAKLVTKSPLSMSRIGRIIKAMKGSEFNFSDGEIDDVIRAIYVTQSDEDQQLVFALFDTKLSETGAPQTYLSAEAFKKLLPLLGDNVNIEAMEAKFKEVDSDGSGKLEFNEFQALIASLSNE